jgi:hypothetical protein
MVDYNAEQNYRYVTIMGQQTAQSTTDIIGIMVRLIGRNFDLSNNTVLFNGQVVAANVPARLMPKTSEGMATCAMGQGTNCVADSYLLAFILPYSSTHPDPLPGMTYANQVFTAGTYQVTVQNSHGTSDAVVKTFENP